MAAMANDETVAIELRFQAHKEVAQYLSPKLRALEHSYVDGGSAISKLTDNELRELQERLEISVGARHDPDHVPEPVH